MKNLLTKIVTPGFIAFQAHCWFAYAIVYTFHSPQTVIAMIFAAAIKEFYIDKHFEIGQTFDDNLGDFCGYLAGIVLAVLAVNYIL